MAADAPPKPEELFAGGAPKEPKQRGPGRPRGARDSKPRAPRTTRPPLHKPLQQNLATIGLVVSVYNADDGKAILAGAERLALSLEHLADENPAVRRVLEALVTASAWGEVAGAVAAIALPIMVNHGMLGPGLSGMFGPDATPDAKQDVAAA